jgi:hypothetical protein
LTDLSRSESIIHDMNISASVNSPAAPTRSLLPKYRAAEKLHIDAMFQIDAIVVSI